MDKKEIRKIIATEKSSLTDADRVEKSRAIAQSVFENIKDLPPTHVSLFMSMPDEVDTHYLIEMLREQGKHTILIPRVEDKTTIRFYKLEKSEDLAVSKYGILEPKAPVSEAIVPEVMIVPGVAFDKNGGRVGHGRGYYDRFFALHESSIKLKIAIGYQLQVLPTPVPMYEFDRYMDMLITEDAVLTF